MDQTAVLSNPNRLLDSLTAQELERFVADSDMVDLKFGQVLAEPGERILHVYFPIDCLASLIVTLESGARLEVSMVGNEGMVGVSLMLGVQESSIQVLVKGGGTALRMSSACFQDHLERSPALKKAIKRYLNALMSQIAQSAACAHFHAVEPRLARWLLMTHDRTQGDQLHLTHEFLSSMLGVRRSGVTVAAKALQSRGLIGYQRGKITVHDRPGLEEASCHCYVADRQIYDRMLERVAFS
ncbi:Crp/Fnr family transcriptional regulator [Halopseudomonas salina]|uniref:Crp/Fnr family transcriptional regulator n=1 Tax=Halopseudomonas salina TaxID=1323744 RepID=A0ABQ1P3H5_9GAMM|nr:Crp/Fnr family transcriptional regulator [Halopseudomonas salina]GGC86080.1 Crp/Fnr family transcriptional regulator [Halopseudomonas salina]